MLEIKVPELAESISEGTIAQWLKEVGQQVDPGEPIMELETDKVNLEVTADQAGILQQILKQPGDIVHVGEVVALLNVDLASAPGSEQDSDTLGTAGTVGSAETTGVSGSAGATEAAGISETAEAQKAVVQAGQSEVQIAESAEQNRVASNASPAARRLAREQGRDLKQTQQPPSALKQTQPTSVSHQAQQIPTEPKAQQADHPGDPSVQSETKAVERIRMSRRRQTIAARLVEAQQTAAMLTTFNEVDMSAIIDLRSRRRDAFFEQNKVKLGFMSFFTKAVVGALKQFPLLNAELQDDEILVKKYYDIGIAVSAKEGLVVPVVRGADRLSFAEIERDIGSLAQKAQDNALKLDDLLGGTFTITNGGIFGSLLSTPILNTPQVGILGMHTIQTRPVAIDKVNMENRPMMYIALSYDHRIVDGREAVGFLVKVKQLLEDPETLLLEG